MEDEKEQIALAAKPSAIDKAALAFSGIFSPLVVPTYACAMALWITRLSVLEERIRLVVSVIIFIIVSGIPFAVMTYMMSKGKVSDAAISDRRERSVPFMIAGLCYLAAYFYLSGIKAPHWLSMFFLGAAACTLCAIIINLYWKISVHMITMGGVVAMLLFIALHGLGVVSMMPWLTGGILISGFVGASRIQLGRHTPAQVYAGWLLGFGLIFAIM